MAIAWSPTTDELRRAGRLDPDYFDPRVESVTRRLKSVGAIPLGAYVASAYRGCSPDYEENGEVRVIKTANVRRFELGSSPNQHVSRGFAENSNALIPYGALLITATGVGSAGRSMVKLDREPMIADAHVTITVPDSLSESAYLCAFLQSPVGLQQLLRLRRGSSRQIEIYPEDILSIPVPRLPPQRRRSISRRWLSAARGVQESTQLTHEVEKRIVSSIGLDDIAVEEKASVWTENLSKLAKAARIDPGYANPRVEKLRKRIMRNGGLPLSKLIVDCRRGIQPDHYVENGPVRVVKSKDVDYPELDLGECETTDGEDWPYYLKGGDLLFNVTGEGTLGRASVIPHDYADLPLIAAVDVYTLTIDRAIVLPEYLALYLNSTIGRELSTAVQTGSSGQQHLYPVHFSHIPVMISRMADGKPDLAWQEEIIAIANSRVMALARARAVASSLDEEFLEAVGVPVDLSVLPT